MSGELKVGPELDAAVAELMGIRCSIVRSGMQGELPPPLPYSTTDEGAGKVLDWLARRGWNYTICGSGDRVAVVVYNPRDCSILECFTSETQPTRPEAICRAALKTKRK